MTSTDATAKARAINATAANLAANRLEVTRKVHDFAGTLGRSGDAGPSSIGAHSDPTCSAALAVDPMRDIDVRWRKALASAAGWSRFLLGDDCPTDVARALKRASEAIVAGAGGSMVVGRLYRAACDIDDIIGECRPRLDEIEVEQGPKVCPSCVSEHTERRVMCKPCDQLHRRYPEYDDAEFIAWVQRRIVEGTLARPHSRLHQVRAA